MPVATDAWVKIGAATSASFSKDGKTISHLRGAGLPQVWAMDSDGANPRQLSFHDEKVAFIRRAPTDDRLIWGIDAGGDERQQFVLLNQGAEPARLTDAAQVIHDFGAWSPDGSRIVFAANDRTERLFDIIIMDLASGQRTRVLHGEGVMSAPGWSPDGTKLLVNYDFSSSDQRTGVVDIASGAWTMIPTEGPTRFASLRWMSDGNTLQGLTDAGGSDFMRLCQIDPATGGITQVYAVEGRDIEAWSLAPNGQTLATIENDRGYSVVRVGPLGADRPVVTGLPGGIASELAWAPDSARLVLTAQSSIVPSGLWVLENGAVRALVQPDPTEAGIDPASLIALNLVDWTSFDGMRIPGWYALPKTPMPPGGYPSVVWVHGGPVGQTRPNFRVDIQMLLSRGFAVLMPNIRGSSGYGRAYMEADEVDLRPDVLEDLAAGRAWLAAQKGIDPERIGIMGQSYGGWVVLAAITLQPSLWKAAVNYYGIADFVTLLDRTGPWRSDHRAREYGFAGVNDDLFARISPIHHVDHVVAPLLVAHGDRDPRVPMHESDQFVTALELRQKKVRYERFTYAGHGFIRPDHRRRVYAAVAEHFHTHL